MSYRADIKVNTHINELDDKINVITRQQPNFEGWTEKCITEIIVERYELVEQAEDNYDAYCQTYQKCLEDFDDEIGCDTLDGCKLLYKNHRNEMHYEKPYIHFWNETVCTEMILIKKLN